jgi:hypothetical protein
VFEAFYSHSFGWGFYVGIVGCYYYETVSLIADFEKTFYQFLAFYWIGGAG